MKSFHVSSIITRLFQHVLRPKPKSDCYFVKLGRSLIAVRTKTNFEVLDLILFVKCVCISRLEVEYTRKATVGAKIRPGLTPNRALDAWLGICLHRNQLSLPPTTDVATILVPVVYLGFLGNGNPAASHLSLTIQCHVYAAAQVQANEWRKA